MSIVESADKHRRIYQLLEQVEELDPQDQGRKLLSIIGNIDLSKGRPAKRIATADVLLKFTITLCRQHGTRYAGLPIPLSPSEQASLGTVLHVLSQLEAIYHMSFRELTNRDRTREKDDKEFVGRSLIGRVSCALEVLLLSSSGYLAWPQKIWSSLHLTYRHAAKLGLADFRPGDPGDDEAQNPSVSELYQISLLVGLCDPFRMPRRGIIFASEMFFNSRSLFHIEEFSNSSRDANLFLLKLGDDTPAVPLHNVDINNMQGNRLVLNVTRLVKQFQGNRDSLKTGDDDTQNRTEILQHLVRTLGIRPTRGTDRVPDQTTYNLLIGFKSLHAYFASTTGTDISEAISLTGETEEIVTLHQSEPVIAKGVDISPTGIKVSLSMADPVNLRSGEIVAFWAANTDDTPVVGFVRWSKTVSPGKVETGIEFLEGIPASGTLSTLDQDSMDFSVLDCLVLTRDHGKLDGGIVVAPNDFEKLRELRQLWTNDVTRVIDGAEAISGNNTVTSFSARFLKNSSNRAQS